MITLISKKHLRTLLNETVECRHIAQLKSSQVEAAKIIVRNLTEERNYYREAFYQLLQIATPDQQEKINQYLKTIDNGTQP